MTFRPRIRTLKPEMWADEKIGQLSRDARLLFVGLITMADDEGRLRALPAAIIGHVFPYDDDVTNAKLAKWMRELEQSGLIVTYEASARPYAALTGWSKHQKVNRSNPSELPPAPDTNTSMTRHDRITDASVNDHDAVTDGAGPHAQAGAIADRDRDLPPLPPQGEITVDCEEWLLHYEQTTGHQLPARTTKAFKSIVETYGARRAEGHSAADLKAATVGAHADEYRREHGYDTAESILRPTKVGALIAKGRLRSAPVVVDDEARRDRLRALQGRIQ